ncbi:hypothetical protein ACOMHN_049231 [Nucella lapillus]
MAFVCYRCNKAVTHRDARDRHVRLVHRHQKLYQCPICGTEFGRKDNYDSHRRVCKEEEDLAYLCVDCDNVFSRKRDLVRHACRNKRRKRRIPHPPAVDLSPRKRGRPAVVEEETEVTVPGDIPEEVGELYRDNWGAWSGDTPDWDGPLSAIFESQTKRFKINASHFFILHHREDNRYRFFNASQNNARLFDRPRLINDRNDFDRCLEDFHAEDALEYARWERPDSKSSAGFHHRRL